MNDTQQAGILRIVPFLLHINLINLIPTWISNYDQYKVLFEIIYPLQNFNGYTVEV